MRESMWTDEGISGEGARHPLSSRTAAGRARDGDSEVAAFEQITTVPAMLQILCKASEMGFAAVARVTERSWVAYAVEDALDFGLKPDSQLEVNRMLGLEALESRKTIVIDHASANPGQCDPATANLNGIESYISVPIILPDGRYFGNLCAIDPRPAKLPGTRLVGLFKAFAQLIGTQLEIEIAREEERAARLDERAASELREQFIAVLGHDLRNPLAAISASSALLAKRVDDPVLAAVAGRINTSTRRMSCLIDDVLDFARAHLGGGLEFQFQTIDDVESHLRSVVNELQDSHPGRHIITDIAAQGRLRCDLGRLQQLTSNLLGNALTHGSPGGPVRLTASTAEGNFVLQVWNDGEPIPPESIGKIFGPFWRNSKSEARQGLGLGLHICSEIVKAHGGRLSVASTRANGTQFTAYLPLGNAR
jgi:signal transduction histidine kinase